MPDDSILAYQAESRTLDKRPVSFIVGGRIYEKARPESPLKERNVRIRDIQDFVFLDNFGRKNISRAITIQRHYRLRRFAFPAFELVQNFRRRRFETFVYLSELCHSYHRLLEMRNTSIKKHYIERICKLARLKHRIKRSEQAERIATQREVFKRMLVLYELEARLLKLAKYYQKQYSRRLKNWVFQFLRFKLSFARNLREQEEYLDFYKVYLLTIDSFKMNYLIEFYGIFVAEKEVYINNLRCIIERETLLRPSLLLWLNEARYRKVSFKTRTRLHCTLLLSIFDLWQNASSGRHAALRYYYAKWRLFYRDADPERENVRSDTFYRRFRFSICFTKLKQNCALEQDLRMISAVFATEKSGIWEFILRVMRQLVTVEVVFVGNTLQKASFCEIIDEEFALKEDYDEFEYKKQSYNRTLFRSYDDEFCMKFKVIFRLKSGLMGRKAFLRLGVLCHVVSNISRLVAAFKCWKMAVESDKLLTSHKAGEGNEYKAFGQIEREFLFSPMLFEIESRFVHVGGSYAALRQAIEGLTEIYCKPMAMMFFMTLKELQETFENAILAENEGRLSAILMFRHVIEHIRYVKEPELAQETSIIESDDATFFQRVHNLKHLIRNCSPQQFLIFLENLRGYFGISSTDLLTSVRVIYFIRPWRIFTNECNIATYSQFLGQEERKTRNTTNFFERTTETSPLCGFEAVNDIESEIPTDIWTNEPMESIAKQQREQLYGEESQDVIMERSSAFFLKEEAVLKFLEHQSKTDLDDAFFLCLLSKGTTKQISREQSWVKDEEGGYAARKAPREEITLNSKLKIQQKSISKLTQLSLVHRGMSQMFASAALSSISGSRKQSSANLTATVDQFEQLAQEFPLEPADVYLYGFGIPKLEEQIESSKPPGRQWDFSEFDIRRESGEVVSVKKIGGEFSMSEISSSPKKPYDYFSEDRINAANTLNTVELREGTESCLKADNFTEISAKINEFENVSYNDPSIGGVDNINSQAHVFAKNHTAIGRESGLTQELTNSGQAGDAEVKRKSLLQISSKETAKSTKNSPQRTKKSAKSRLPTPSFADASSKERMAERNKSDEHPNNPYVGDNAVRRTMNSAKRHNTALSRDTTLKNQTGTRTTMSSIVIPERAVQKEQNTDFESFSRTAKTYDASSLGIYERDTVASHTSSRKILYESDRKAINHPFDDFEIDQVETTSEVASNEYLLGYGSESMESDKSSEIVCQLEGVETLESSFGDDPADYLVGSMVCSVSDEMEDLQLYSKELKQFASECNSTIDLDALEHSHEFYQELSDRYRNKLLSNPKFVDFAKESIGRIRQQYKNRLTFSPNDQFIEVAIMNSSSLGYDKVDTQKLVNIITKRDQAKVSLEKQFEEKYIDTLIEERMAIREGEKDLTFMYGSNLVQKISNENTQQNPIVEQKKPAKNLENTRLLAQMRVKDIIEWKKQIIENKEAKKLEIERWNQEKAENISVMLKRHMNTTIDELASRQPRLFSVSQRDPGRLTASIVGRSISPNGYIQSQQVTCERRPISFSSRRTCDNFIYELGKLRMPELFALFKEFEWKQHIFTPIVYWRLSDEELIQQKAAQYSEKLERETFNYLLKSLTSVDFSQEMPTTVVTRFVGKTFQYEEIRLGFDAPQKAMDLDAVLTLTAKRVPMNAEKTRQKMQRTNQITQRIDYAYLNGRTMRQKETSRK